MTQYTQKSENFKIGSEYECYTQYDPQLQRWMYVITDGITHPYEKNYEDGFSTREDAENAAISYSKKHSWEYVDRYEIFDIWLRFWPYHNEWGYSVRCGGMDGKSGFKTRKDALTAAYQKAEEKYRILIQ